MPAMPTHPVQRCTDTRLSSGASGYTAVPAQHPGRASELSAVPAPAHPALVWRRPCCRVLYHTHGPTYQISHLGQVMEASVGREKIQHIRCQASELCWSETDMNSTPRAPSFSEAQLFGGIWHRCVPISGVICRGSQTHARRAERLQRKGQVWKQEHSNRFDLQRLDYEIYMGNRQDGM